jgi:hypothetical protein
MDLSPVIRLGLFSTGEPPIASQIVYCTQSEQWCIDTDYVQ